MTNFCERQYQKSYKGVPLTEETVKKLISLTQNPYKVSPGYSKFSKVITLKNLQEDGSFYFPNFKTLVVNASTLAGTALPDGLSYLTKVRLPELFVRKVLPVVSNTSE